MLKMLIVFISFLVPVLSFSASDKSLPLSNAIYLGDSVTTDSQFPFVVALYKKISDEAHGGGLS